MANDYFGRLSKKIFAVVLSVIILVSSTAACFAAVHDVPSWENYINTQIDDYFTRDAADLSYIKNFTLEQINVLEQIKNENPDDWLLWAELADHEDTMCILMESVSEDVQNNVLNKEYSDRSEASLRLAKTMMSSETIERIEKKAEPDLVKGYRLLCFAQNIDQRETIIEAYEKAWQYLKYIPYGIMALLGEMGCYFDCPSADSFLALQIYGTEEMYDHLYSDANVIDLCENIIVHTEKILQNNVSNDVKDALIQRAAEANAFLAYSAFFDNDADEILACLEKAQEIDTFAVGREISLASSFYKLHIKFLHCYLVNDEAAMDYTTESLIDAYDLWRQSGSLYFDYAATEQLIEDTNRLLDLWYN